jgi:hypothetical protein
VPVEEDISTGFFLDHRIPEFQMEVGGNSATVTDFYEIGLTASSTNELAQVRSPLG